MLGWTIDAHELLEGLVLIEKVSNSNIIGLIQCCLSAPKEDTDNQIV
jgi:hypothetical protein